MKLIRCIPLGLLFVSGCTSGTMVRDTYNGQTDASTRTVYSKYYDAGVWLIPQRLGMSVVVDHEKSYVPIVSGVQQSLGALGPGDSSANGKVTIYIWNVDTQRHPVKILRVVASGQTLKFNSALVDAPPADRRGGVAGNIQIFNYGTEIPVEVVYETNGKQATAKLKLERRTAEQLKAYFGPGGSPPYPWSKSLR